MKRKQRFVHSFVTFDLGKNKRIAKKKGCQLTTIGRLMTPVSLLRVASKAIMVTRPTLSQHLGGKMVIMVMRWRVMMTMMTRAQ